jgi:hypothetical protein
LLESEDKKLVRERVRRERRRGRVGESEDDLKSREKRQESRIKRKKQKIEGI